VEAVRGAHGATLCGVVAALVLTLGSGSAAAGERSHRVRSGESASAIAKRYYGDYELASLLLLYNGRAGSVIRPGEELRVPFVDVHEVRPGDSWSALVQRYMRRTSVYPVVAELNGLAPRKPLRVGQKIVLPVVLQHRLARGESLSTLAERFYGDPASGGLLQDFNRISDPRRLSVGQTVEIPLMTLRLVSPTKTPPAERVAEQRPAGKAASGPTDEEAAAPEPANPEPSPSAEPDPSTEPTTVTEEKPAEPEPRPEPPKPSYLPRIRTANAAWEAGDYERARSLLESIREPVTRDGSDEERAAVGRLLAFVYVAFDLPDEACEAFRSLAPGQGVRDLDANRVSPRIRGSLADCAAERTALP
jgi:LysM repeat protein